MKNEVGLKTIAIELGVSLTTVSRALNDKSDISDEMKRKVRQKAIELKYTPNQAAKALSTGSSKMVGVIVDSLRSPYFSLVVEMMAKALKKNGYSLCLYPSEESTATFDDVKSLVSAGISSIVTFLIPDVDAVDYAAVMKRNLIVMGRYSKALNSTIYCADDRAAGYDGAKYLVEKKGCSKIAYVRGNVKGVNDPREAGFMDYVTSHGIPHRLYDDSIAGQNAEDTISEDGIEGILFFDDHLAERFLQKTHKAQVVGINAIGAYTSAGLQFPSLAPDYQRMVDELASAIKEAEKYDSIRYERRIYKMTVLEPKEDKR